MLFSVFCLISGAGYCRLLKSNIALTVANADARLLELCETLARNIKLIVVRTRWCFGNVGCVKSTGWTVRMIVTPSEAEGHGGGDKF